MSEVKDKKVLDELVRKLNTCLSQFESSEFRPYDYDNPNTFNHASIAITTHDERIEGLTDFVNSQLSPQNGHRVELVSIGLKKPINEKGRYCVDVIPNEELYGERRVEAVNNFLRSLPKVIRDYKKRFL